MSIQERKIEDIKETVKEGLKILNRSEGKVENLTQQKKDLDNEIREQGIEPELLKNKIESLKQEIVAEKENLEKKIPFELINKLINGERVIEEDF